MMLVRLSAATILVLTAAASDGYAQQPLLYRCDDGGQITVRFQAMRSVRLTINGKTMVLPIARSGSGSRYAKGRTVFWIKGRNAMFIRGKRTTNCSTRS